MKLSKNIVLRGVEHKEVKEKSVFPPMTDYFKNRFYDELIAHIILAGGTKFERSHLENIPVFELINMLYNNYIVLQLKNTRKENK